MSTGQSKEQPTQPQYARQLALVQLRECSAQPYNCSDVACKREAGASSHSRAAFNYSPAPSTLAGQHLIVLPTASQPYPQQAADAVLTKCKVLEWAASGGKHKPSRHEGIANLHHRYIISQRCITDYRCTPLNHKTAKLL